MRKLNPAVDSDKAIQTAAVAAAWKATKDLPEAPEALVRSAVFFHDNNQAAPYSPADPMDGRAGKGSCAHNAILLHCAGFRVSTKLIKAILASHKFHGKPHVNVDNHTKDLACIKLHSSGHFAICNANGFQACNPLFLAAIGRPLPDASIENATGLEAAAKALDKPKAESKPFPTGKGNKPASKRTPTAKAILALAEDNATPLDLAAGKAVKASK